MNKVLYLLLISFLNVVTPQSISRLNDDIESLYQKSFAGYKLTLNDFQNVMVDLKEISELQIDNKAKLLKKDNAFMLFNFLDTLANSAAHSDSIYKSIYTLYLKFYSAIDDEYVTKQFTTNNKKLIFLTTSVSCECTISMGHKHLSELIKFMNDNLSEYELIIEDAWEKTTLKDSYEVGLIPTVILLDKNNEEMIRFVRTNNLRSELLKFLGSNK